MCKLITSSNNVLYFLSLLLIAVNVFAEPTLRFEKLNTQASSHQFVDNRQCLNCHAEQANQWQNSHHAKAMQVANSLTIKGDFNNATFTHNDISSTFSRENDAFFVNTIGPDNTLADFKIKYTFGVDPLQQYIVELEKGRLQTLDIAWDTREKNQGGQRWFKLLPDEHTNLDGPLHWTGLNYRWNNRCAECHSTNVQKNYDLTTDSYNTSWSEINVSCQSCHGPGSEHVNRQSLNDPSQQPSATDMLVDYSSMNQQDQSETCARCHSRRHQVSPIDGHGKSFLDDFLPSILTENLYHADGQILDEVFVYGSFLQSKMYANGVGCLDCHTPHSGQLKLSGNALCLQCHQDSPPKQRFPSLQAKNYNDIEHHFHQAGSEGALCVNCHMPATTFMEIDPRRDHSFNIPRPALSLKINTPNACNNCHRDKSTQWASDVVDKWYGKTVLDGQSYGELIYATRQGDAVVLPELVSKIHDPKTPAIQAATLIRELVKYFPQSEALESTVASLKHPDPLVRATATNNLEQIPIQYRTPLVTPLLNDPVRAVRINAVSVSANIPDSELADSKIAFDAALVEYQALQNSLSDTAEAHLNLGVLYSNQQKFKLAEDEFKQAMVLNPYFLPAYFNLANLYNHLGNNKEAELIFTKAIEIAPDNGEAYYSLGLLLAEQSNYAGAIIRLAKATELLPDRPRVAYNYALSLQHIEQYAAAEAVLKQAYAKAPTNSEFVHALVIIYVQQKKWPQALEYAEQLLALSPGEQEPARLLKQIQYQIKYSAGQH